MQSVMAYGVEMGLGGKKGIGKGYDGLYNGCLVWISAPQGI